MLGKSSADYIMSPTPTPRGGEHIWFWCGSHWHQRDTSCLHNILWTSGWILNKFSWILYGDLRKNWVDFGDLDLILKVTAIEKLKVHSRGHLFSLKTLLLVLAATSENLPSYMCPQWNFRSTCAFAQSDQNLHWLYFWIGKDVKFLHADNKDSDQTAQTCRLNCVFIGSTCQKACLTLLSFELLFFFIFPRKLGLIFHADIFKDFICMECQVFFLGIIRIDILQGHLLKVLPSMQSINA